MTELSLNGSFDYRLNDWEEKEGINMEDQRANK